MEIMIQIIGWSILAALCLTCAVVVEVQAYRDRQTRDRLRARVYGNHPAGTGRRV